MGERSAWFVRSMGDADTHRGVYSPATRSVHARCGIEFQPVPIGWPPKLGPVPANPPDPKQICPQCHAELPQRGPHVPHHEPWPDQPFSQAAFDPLDPTILRLVDTPTAPSAVLQPVIPESITYEPGAADLEDDLTLYDEGDAEIDPVPPPPPGQPEHRRRRWPTTWLA